MRWQSRVVVVVLLGVDGGVPATSTLAVVAATAVMAVLPGTLLWRWVRGDGTEAALSDLAIGASLGLGLESLVYVAARWAGAPLASLLWPVLVVVGALVWRRQGRREREPSGGVPVPTGVLWGLAGVVLFPIVVAARTYFPALLVTDESLRAPSVDEPYHLALVGELMHHVPPEVPYVAGTPLYYHWLSYAQIADTAWLTGVDPLILTRFLSGTVFLAVSATATAAVAARLARSWWPALVATLLFVWGAAPDVLPSTPWHQPALPANLAVAGVFTSPSVGFGVVVFPAVVALVHRTLTTSPEARLWVITGASMLVLGGAKSVYLPSIVAGLTAAALLARAGTRRRGWGLVALGVAVFAASTVVFYGGSSRSLTWAPLAFVRWTAERTGTAVAGGWSLGLAGIGLATLGAALLMAAGALGVLRMPGWWRDSVVVFLGAGAAAALAVFLMTDHPGLSQVNFVTVSMGLVAYLNAIGLAELSRNASRRAVAVAAVAASAGLVLVVVLAVGGGILIPAGWTVDARLAAQVLLLPVLVVAVVGLAVLGARLGRLRRPEGVLVGVALVLGASLVVPAREALRLVRYDDRIDFGEEVVIGSGGVKAADWLRAASDPDDLIATNAHCVEGPVEDCERRNFWMASHTERRLVLEGWAFVPPETVGLPSTPLTNSTRTPFWDAGLLEDNDAVFTDPSPSSLQALKSRTRVDWLLVDTRYPHDRDGLDALAHLEFESGDYLVYRSPSASGH